MEIKGIFGVEIKDSSGNLIKRIECNNTVTDLAVKQVKRWLDRDNCINIDGGIPEFTSGIMAAGDMKRISVSDDLEILYDTESTDYPFYPLINAFDGNDETMYYYWNSDSTWIYQDIRFKEPVNLAGVGFLLMYDSSSYWSAGRRAAIQIRFDGFTVSLAGNGAYNGTEWIRLREKHNGHEYYKKDGVEYYVFVNTDGTKWQMSTSLGGTIDYETDTTLLPEHPWSSIWVLVNGSAPAPVLVEGTSTWRWPYLTSGNEYVSYTDNYGRDMSHFWKDHQNDDTSEESDRYFGKYGYRMRTFESVEDIYNSGDQPFEPKWYGYIPYVKDIRYILYSNSNGDSYWSEYSRDIYEAIPHPQNPYALKLGVDDGTILPLSVSNTDLGDFYPGMEWKCDNVFQNGDYIVRYSKNLGLDDANNITFKEIGLFMNADGHLPNKLLGPQLENATDLFARTFFDTPWNKTPDQTATIYYEITVN